MTKPVLNQVNTGPSKSSALYEHSINTNNGLPKYQQPNHYGFPSMEHNKSNRLEYQQDSQELRIATIAALSQQIKGNPFIRIFVFFSFLNVMCNILVYWKISKLW